MNEDKQFFIRGAGGGGIQPSRRSPIEVDEGVSGQFIESGGGLVRVPRAVSLTQIRVLDLVSEGEIEGLVSGEYNYVGQPGNVGYDNVTFKPYGTKSVNGVPISYLRSVYWNETPVVDKDNLFNFQQIDVVYTNGLPNGSSAVGIGDELTISRNIQERLRGPNSVLDDKSKVQIIGEVEQFAKYYRILNKDCSAVNINVRVNALSKTVIQGAKAGDTTATNIFYRIYYKPLFSKAGGITAENAGPEEQEGYIFSKEEEINGKISFGYIRSSRIEFDSSYSESPGFVGWAVKIFRTTPDSLQGSLRNQTYIDSLTEIYSNSFCYPNSAIVSQKFNAEYFSQIPSRAFDLRLLKVKIPSNYDPIKKKYHGDWDGSWKTDENGDSAKFWTDNPAWCFYDLVTNSRYGLGKHIDSSLVDKWTLYEISQYCDTLVPDGLGGVEPRFTCNMIITSREEAYRVLNDMASIFRAIVYYFAGGIYTSMDVEKDPIYQFTNANVEDGDFVYSSSSKRVRHSVAVVRYNDKTNFYQPSIEYVEDAEAIKKYGYKELDIAAFGCTSRGQAIRYGRWALLSEGLETETVSFSAGLEASYLRPGDIFSVFDRYKKNVRHGGRILNAFEDPDSKNSCIVLDDRITGLADSTFYNLNITTPTFNFEPSQVTNLTSQDISAIRNKQIQTVTFSGGDVLTISGYSAIYIDREKWARYLDFQSSNIPKYSIWSIEASGDLDNFSNQLEYYRAIKIEEKEENKYAINALQYDVNKYKAVDSGLNFQNITIAAQVVTPPDSLSLSFGLVPGSTTLKGIKYIVGKNNLDGVNGFLVYARLGPWEPNDFSERFSDSPPQIVPQTPDNRYNINILTNASSEGTYIPLSNGTYYFRVYSRNILGIPSEQSIERTITVSSLNNFQSLVIQSLRLEGNSDNILQDKKSETYTATEPIYTWQSSFGQQLDSFYSVGDLYYRITLRKTTNQSADNPAEGFEKPGGNDPYQPSNVIYYTQDYYKPDDPNNPNFKFDLITNMSSFLLKSGYTGILREYDVVVEAHLLNGDSSAGGNINGSRGGISDSAFSSQNKNGWDILYVNNPRIPSIQLTENTDLETCRLEALNDINALTAINKVCSEQWINSDGTVNIKIHTNNLPSDIAGGYVFSCKKSFNQYDALSGVTNNGDEVYASEFSELSDPIVATSNLVGLRSGFIALAFYDQIDKAFKDEVATTNPDFSSSFISGLNISNIVVANSRGISSAQSQYLSWCKFNLDMQPETTAADSALKINSLSWVGAGVISCNIDGFKYTIGTSRTPSFVNVKVDFDTSIVKSHLNVGRILSYDYNEMALNNNNEPIGLPQYKNLDKLVIGNLSKSITPQQETYWIVYPSGLVEYDNIASNNSFITFRVRVPHEIDDNVSIDGRLSRIKSVANVFIGITANEAENSNIVDVSEFSSVKNRL